MLYRDFLFTQTPLLPYVYGAWAELVGERWLAMRLLSVAFALALATLLYRDVRARADARLGAAAVGLFACSTFVFTWYPTFKTYALATLLLFGAYVLVERVRASRLELGAAGALAALSVETRTLLVGGAIALVWGVWRSGRARALAAFVLGFAVALVPSIVLFAVDPERFVFGNLLYHGQRSARGLVGNPGQKVEVAATLLGIATEARPIPQYLLLVLAAAVAAVTVRSLTGRVPLALLVAAGLAIVAFFPTPTYTQYFATTVPFLIAGALQVVPALRRDGRRMPRPFLAALTGAAVAAYVAFGAADLYRATTPSTEIRPRAVQEVADVIAANVRPGDAVVSGFTGYLFGTDARPWPGLENSFATHAAASAGPAEARQMHLATVVEIEEAIRDRRTPLVVTRVWHDLPPIPDYEGAARAAGYRLLSDVNGVRIYAAP